MSLDRIIALGRLKGSADRVFTNRVDEREAFETSLALVRKVPPSHVDDLDEPRRNVLGFYGLGGIGKSRLAEHLLEGTGDKEGREQLMICRFDFESVATIDFESVLLRLRAHLGQARKKWDAFDLGLAAYWQRRHPGEPPKEFIRRKGLVPSLATDIDLVSRIESAIDELLKAFGTVAAASTITKLVAGATLQKLKRRRLIDGCQHFDHIVTARDVDEMLLYLPLLLAWDLARYQQEESIDVVVVFDTWEQVQKIHGVSGSVEDSLTRLIYLMPNVLFLVTGRGRLTWADRRSDIYFSGPDRWPNLVRGQDAEEPRQHLLGPLSPEDCEEYLRIRLVEMENLPVGPELRRVIVETSDGVPLYLTLAALRIEQMASAGKELKKEDVAQPLPQLIRRIMRDLDREERDLVRVASLLTRFSPDLLRKITGVADGTLARFCSRPLVEIDEEGWLRYQIHQLVREQVLLADYEMRDGWSESEWDSARSSILTFLEDSVSEDVQEAMVIDHQRLKDAFVQGVVVAAYPGKIPGWQAIAAMRLQRLGYWTALSAPAGLVPEENPLQPALKAMGSLVTRTTGGLGQAVELLRRGLHQPGGTHMRSLLELFLAKTLIVKGDLDEAKLLLEGFENAGEPWNPIARKDLARVAWMQGSFHQAREWVIENLSPPPPDPLLRFSVFELAGALDKTHGRLSSAEANHRATLDAAVAARSSLYEARARRHLANVVGWYRPADALRLAREALEANQAVGDLIGEAQARHALSLTSIGQDDDAAETQLGEADRLWAEAEGHTNSPHSALARVFMACLRRQKTEALHEARRIEDASSPQGSHSAVTARAWIAHTWGETWEYPSELEWLDPVEAVCDRWIAVLEHRRNPGKS